MVSNVLETLDPGLIVCKATHMIPVSPLQALYSHGLNSLKGDIQGILEGSSIGVITGI